MSLLPTMIWLNIPFSPHQKHLRPPPPLRERDAVYGPGQYDGTMLCQRAKSLRRLPGVHEGWGLAHTAAAPLDRHQRDEAEQRREDQVIAWRQAVAEIGRAHV